MKGLVDFSCALLLLVDVVVCLAVQPPPELHPDTPLRGMTSGSRRTVQRHRTKGLPLYMLQLYRTMLNENRGRTPAASVGRTGPEDNRGLQESDSVISFVAKSK